MSEGRIGPVYEEGLMGEKNHKAYYAVIFTSLNTGRDAEEYTQTAEHMIELAKSMPGFLGIESAHNKDGSGVTVSYWTDESAIADWKKQAEHMEAQRNGKNKWYENYTVRVAKIEREYGMKRGAIR